jgi:transposase
MDLSLPVIGIDVSKATLDAHWGSQKGKRWHLRVPNTASGLASLQEWILSHQVTVVHCCLEATGTYSDAVAMFCHTQGHRVSVIHPSNMHEFCGSEGIHGKTDAMDARLIALYGEQKRPKPWHPVSFAVSQLKRDLDRLDELKAAQQQERNRLENQRLDEEARQEIQVHITWLQERQEHWYQRVITRFTQAWWQEHDGEAAFQLEATNLSLLTGPGKTWRKRRALLGIAPIDAMIQVMGVGQLTALRIFAVFATLQDDQSSEQVACYFGVVPHMRSSGTSVKGKPQRRGGNRQARTWLYQAALSSKRHDPDMAQWAQELEGRGLCKKAVTLAVMHKLVRILFGLYKHPGAYDASKAFPTHVHPLEAVAA